MLSARTATTATEIAMMAGCWDARASRDPEGHVVGGQPLQVTGHAPADAERADRDHGYRNRDDGGVLGRPGQQEPGGGEQPDAAAGGGGPGRGREQQPAAQRPAAARD